MEYFTEQKNDKFRKWWLGCKWFIENDGKKTWSKWLDEWIDE